MASLSGVLVVRMSIINCRTYSAIATLVVVFAFVGQAIASVQINTVTRGVSTGLAQIENAIEHSVGGIAADPQFLPAKEQGIYYYEMTHSLVNMARGKLSYTLLGNTDEDSKASRISKASSAGARRQSSPATSSALALRDIPQQMLSGRAKAFQNQLGFSAFQNSGEQANWNSGGSGSGSGSFAPGSSMGGGPAGSPGVLDLTDATGGKGPEMMFASGSAESSARPALGNGAVDPTAVVPELSAMVTWIILSPLGAMALTARRSRLIR